MRSQPLVSVIITTYNREHLVGRAIESVLAQTYKNIEIIIVDDCSTDNTATTIEKHEGNIKYIRNVTNVGRSASRNVGIRASSGEYLSFLDDDDELLPGKIKKQIELFSENDNIDVVYCGNFKKNKNYVVKEPARLRGNIFPKVLDTSPNAIHTLLIKRKCFGLIGFFDENLCTYEELDFWIRLSKECVFDYVDDFLVIYYVHGDQVSANLRMKIAGREMLLQKHKKDYEQNKKYLYWHLRKLASRYALLDEYSMFRKYISKAIITMPFYPGSYIHVFLALVSHSLHRKFICRFGLKKFGDVLLV